MFYLIRTVGIVILLLTSTINISAEEAELAGASECECKPTPHQAAAIESVQDSSPFTDEGNSIETSKEDELSKEIEKEDLSIDDVNTGQEAQNTEVSEENPLVSDENITQKNSEEEESVTEETGVENEATENEEISETETESENQGSIENEEPIEKLEELFDHTHHVTEEVISNEEKTNEESSDENILQDESMEKVDDNAESHELQSEEKNEEIISQEVEEQEAVSKEGEETIESPEQIQSDEAVKESVEEGSVHSEEISETIKGQDESIEDTQSVEISQDEISKEEKLDSQQETVEESGEEKRSTETTKDDTEKSIEAVSEEVDHSIGGEHSAEAGETAEQSIETGEDVTEQSVETGEDVTEQSAETGEDVAEQSTETGEDVAEQSTETGEDVAEQSVETGEDVAEQSAETGEDVAEQSTETGEDVAEQSVETGEDVAEQSVETGEDVAEQSVETGGQSEELASEQLAETVEEQNDKETVTSKEEVITDEEKSQETVKNNESQEETAKPQEGLKIEELPEEEELTMIMEIPEKLRPREHMIEILHLHDDYEETEQFLSKTVEHTLKELKKLYEAAIKPLEILYKYRDLSNRHFGDPEIFSKPLILFMGPWSGGKSTIINYLLENEYKHTALRTGADPSPAYFNIVMWGEDSEILDGTQLAADWTFSGLQKFGQVLLDRLRGLKLNHPLLQKVNIVEIPGILEIRKQVERMFPFNDACQWFIDRADIIFLVYDPSKLDIGPETEAILDQLKGREMQTRIILNKADQVKPEELMRVQGTLIWNISPLMSSTEPPVMYSTSLWSLPYEAGSPTRLLHAQEKAFLSDLRSAIDKRVENKIAGARRFAVRVRNHAKMVDCYLTTYYNHKSFFDNKKHVSDDIIEHPQNYHIYEGLSTLTNISRYDLPDPDVYRDFFRLNPVYEFQQLSSTCTYFRGCPINRLDLAIAYDLPELVGKYKKSVEELLKSYNARK